MSSEAFVDVQDAATPTKHMRTRRATISGTPVDSEVVVLSTDGVDSYDARQLYAKAEGSATVNPVTYKTIGSETALDVNVGNIEQGTLSVKGSQNQLLQQRTSTFELLTQLKNAGSEIDPRAIRTLVAADQVTALGGSGLGLLQDLNGNLQTSLFTAGGVQYDARDVSDRVARLLGRLNGNVSAGNSSTALLGIGAVFTGAYDDATDYATITVSVFTDQASAAGGLEFDWSHDGVNLDASSTTSVSASAGRAFGISPRARFFRVKYTNGAVAQGVFRLGTVYHPAGSGLISRPLSQSMDQENYAQQIRSVTDGFDGSVFQHVGARIGPPQSTDYGLVTRGLVYRNTLLGLYYGESGNQTVLAAAHAATAGFFWLVNTSSTVKAYVRSIGFVWSGTAATAFPTSPRITVERVTFTGTPSGATLTPAKRASTDATNIATLRTASTGMTLTAGAVIESFVVGSVLTAVGAISVPEEMWQSPDDDGMILLGQNEGIVVRQADAGTAADTRKIVMTVAWEER